MCTTSFRQIECFPPKRNLLKRSFIGKPSWFHRSILEKSGPDIKKIMSFRIHQLPFSKRHRQSSTSDPKTPPVIQLFLPHEDFDWFVRSDWEEERTCHFNDYNFKICDSGCIHPEICTNQLIDLLELDLFIIMFVDDMLNYFA